MTDEAPAKSTLHPDLELAQLAFEQGDYARLRALTAPLTTSEDAAISAAARALHARTEIDRAQVAVLLLCLALFVAITYTYVF